MAKAKKSPRNRQRILVVGDWVIDDFWVVGVHRSPTSSRTGQNHFRAQHIVNSSVRDLSGAGRTASLLTNADNGKRAFEIVGLGRWHAEDDKVLEGMFRTESIRGQTPLRMRLTEESAPQNVKLINLENHKREPSRTGEPGRNAGTTRIIRIYQLSGAEVTQLERIDWEVQQAGIDSDDYSLDKIHSVTGEVDAVVMKDLGKGVVSNELMDCLTTRFRSRTENGEDRMIPWFVSSKRWMPDWLGKLAKVDLRLLLIPEIAVKSSLLSAKLPMWITRSGRLSKESLAIVKELGDDFTSSERLRIVILPKGMSAFAFDWKGDSIEMVTQSKTSIRREPVSLNMASVCLAALTARLIADPGIELKPLCRQSLAFTQKWREHEAARFGNPEGWEEKSFNVLQNFASKGLDIEDSNLEKELKQWEQAFSDIGIITDTSSAERPRKYIELTRAMRELDGYICCTESKRNAILKLARGIESFKLGKMERQVSCLIFARPGSGKTHLVECLGNSLDLTVLPFNITQMTSRKDILDCFDRIVTNQVRREPLLVFVDEINALLENQHVYGSFLAPLEEGNYTRGGNTFHVAPAVWIFASTVGLADLRSQDKGSDFVSRLTLGEIDLHAPVGVNSRKSTENVYLGVALIKSIYPDVRLVSKKVLQAFENISKETGVRQLRYFVASLRNIQYGRVTMSNVPFKMAVKLGVGRNLFAEGEPEFIEIRSD